MSSIMRCRSGVTCTFITELSSVGLHTDAILTDEGSNETRASLLRMSRKGRETRIVRQMRNGSFEPYSSSSSPSGLRPNVVSDVANELCHRSDLVLTCAGVFLGCIPGLRPDRSGIALSGAALMLAVGTLI
jgi:hypothetical protein